MKKIAILSFAFLVFAGSAKSQGCIMIRNISGFGQFSVSHRNPRIGVNPRNPSQKIQIPELNTPKFRAGEAFKDAVKLRNS